MKVLCNVDLTKYSDRRVTFIKEDEKEKHGFLSFTNLIFDKIEFIKKNEVDSILIFQPKTKDLAFYAMVKILCPKVDIYYFDLLLKKPKSVVSKIISRVKRILFKFSENVLCVHKDTSAYEKYYGIRTTAYIPFKSNNYDFYKDYSIKDENYVLSCGASHRDYNTLFKAAQDLAINFKVIVPEKEHIKIHKTLISLEHKPDNVEIVTHDFNKDTWNKMIAECTFVVIPIDSDCIQPAGISVYLESMLLRKAVIVSSGPSSNLLIDDGKAIIVKRGSSSEMKEAINDLWINPEKREALAEIGHRYALSLGGTEEHINNIKDVLSSSYKKNTRTKSDSSVYKE
ncbi:glycosyltransferase [Marinimicrobium sp. LS-A18]|uniref:glycosyltransferase n=1 Tax=Marinimicrobium sp. LS-A18 TaxID=1381596 RepID=UPI0004666E97|nr:glycosyltransferase [Marinimicrobium sp. LS-A18]